MQANASLSPSIEAIRETALGPERLGREAESAYWLRFLNGRWLLLYGHQRLISDFLVENAEFALTFFRQKQSERPAQG
jgi:hypothetical protein